MAARVRVRIVGDGTFRGTRVETEDGQLLRNVVGVEYELNRELGLAQAKVTFLKVPVDIVAELPED